MVGRGRWGLLLAAGLGCTELGAAEVPAPPKTLSTADFFRHPNLGHAEVSPGGTYVALLVPDGDKTRLQIAELAGLRNTAAYSMARDEFVGSFTWVNDQQLVWDSVKRAGPLDEIVLTGHLMTGRADRAEGRRIGTGEWFLSRIPGAPNQLLVGWRNEILRRDIVARSSDSVAESNLDGARFVADHQGAVRVLMGLEKLEQVTLFRDNDQSPWQELRRVSLRDRMFDPIAFSADDRQLYVESNVEAPTTGIYRINLQTQAGELLFRDPLVDVDHTLSAVGSKEPAGVLYFPDYPRYHFFDEQSPTARIYADLRGAFPNSIVHLSSSSDDGRIGVVTVHGDTRPTEYYLLDVEKRSLRLLMRSRPWIDRARLSPMSAITIKARDGLELRGYLTLPKGRPERQLPMVVLPHGGPHGPFDRWGFDEEVQFLAYHGYAVLQVNFRGSGGRGREFEALGYRHWGTTMQDDVADATRWAIQAGYADPARVCIYGASYGGYTALMNAVREPDLYRCAIGYAGLYDLTLQTRVSDTASRWTGRDYFDLVLGDADLRKAQSPIHQVERIKAPLLLIHGQEDPRTPYIHFNRLISALKSAGKTYETLIARDEGHGFYMEKNRVAAYDRLLDFLNRHIGQTPAAASTPAAP